MKDGKYHQKIGLPKNAVNLFTGEMALWYGAHAQEAAGGRLMPLPKVARVAPEQVVEIDVVDGIPKKGVVRLPWVDGKDLCLVVCAPDGYHDTRYVVTLWWNNAHDGHGSLDPRKYVTV